MTEIDTGYFDKLLAAPIRRSSIIFGRLTADLVRGLLGSTVVLFAGLAFGAHMVSGILGAIVLVVLAALFGVGYAGFGILVVCDAKRAGHQHELSPLLPAALPNAELRPVRSGSPR